MIKGRIENREGQLRATLPFVYLPETAQTSTYLLTLDRVSLVTGLNPWYDKFELSTQQNSNPVVIVCLKKCISCLTVYLLTVMIIYPVAFSSPPILYNILFYVSLLKKGKNR